MGLMMAVWRDRRKCEDCIGSNTSKSVKADF